MKSCGIGDRLEMVGDARWCTPSEIVIAPGNRRAIHDVDSLWKGVAEVRIHRAAAVAGPPAGIHIKVHEICEPTNLLSACSLAAGQGAKLVEVDCVRTFGREVCVDELFVRELIVGVVVDVLVHIFIQPFKGGCIQWTSSSAWDFTVLNSSELVVLLPEICLDELGGSQEPEN